MTLSDIAYLASHTMDYWHRGAVMLCVGVVVGCLLIAAETWR